MLCFSFSICKNKGLNRKQLFLKYLYCKLFLWCMCVLRIEVDIRHFPSSLSTLFNEERSILNSELAHLANLGSQLAPKNPCLVCLGQLKGHHAQFLLLSLFFCLLFICFSCGLLTSEPQSPCFYFSSLQNHSLVNITMEVGDQNFFNQERKETNSLDQHSK